MSFRTPTEIPNQTPPDRGRLLDSLQKQILERVMPALDRALGQGRRLPVRPQPAGRRGIRPARIARAASPARPDHPPLRRGGAGRLPQPAWRQRMVPDRWPAVGPEPVVRGRPGGTARRRATRRLAWCACMARAWRWRASGWRMSPGAKTCRPQDNPLAPAFLATALRNALGQSELIAGVRIVVFKFFERELGAVARRRLRARQHLDDRRRRPARIAQRGQAAAPARACSG